MKIYEFKEEIRRRKYRLYKILKSFFLDYCVLDKTLEFCT